MNYFSSSYFARSIFLVAFLHYDTENKLVEETKCLHHDNISD